MSVLLAQSSAEPSGYVLGALMGFGILLGIGVLATYCIVKAFTRRTTGWILAGSIAGTFLSLPLVAVLVGIVSGLQSARKSRDSVSYQSGSQPRGSIQGSTQPKSSPKSDATPYILGRAYGALHVPLSRSDTDILLRFGSCAKDWNRESAPLIRDYLDPDVNGDQWVKTSRVQLIELGTICARFRTDCGLLADVGVRDTIRPIVEIHDSMLSLYYSLQAAIIAGDADGQLEVMAELRQAGERKQTGAMPYVKRLRTELGESESDKQINDTINRLGELVKPL